MHAGRVGWLCVVAIAASWSLSAFAQRGEVTPQGKEAPRTAPGSTSPRNANYSIDAELDPQRRLLTGREVITWRNISSAATKELQLHLYYNAWRNSNATWLREQRIIEGASGGRGERVEADTRPESDWSFIDVTAVRLLGVGAAPPSDLTRAVRFVSPDDGNPDDRTLISVPLPEAVGLGGTINLAVEWTLHTPRTFARTGAIDNFFFFGQWFPKVAVFAPSRDKPAWNAHQFHATTEFFADYGAYDVRLTVPRGWIVGATGLPQPASSPREGTTLYRFVQDDVHDFAWVTSPDLVEARARFEDPALPPVDMRLLLQPEHGNQADRHFAATRAALEYYGKWYGPYPYGHITIVDPAWQSGAGGMEYPTLFTAGTRWWAPREVQSPEGVTVHEAGHQFWYLLVGNDEFEHAWLDEGLNTFSTARTMAVAFPPFFHSERFFGEFVPWVFRDVPLTRETDYNGMIGYRPAAESDAMATPSWRYDPTLGRRITYQKTALWLHTLERMLGWPTLQRILSTFFLRYRFAHPTPEDFFAVANEISGQDLTWFFDQVYRSSNVFDYGIQQFASEPATVSGFLDASGGQRRFVRRHGASDVYRTTVMVRRYGEAVFPVDLLVTFGNGETARERWDGRDRWRLYTYERRSRAGTVQIDPQRVLLLDVNYTNNSATLDPAADIAARKWSLAWLVWLQDLLVTYAAFA
jgi:Peptidase family M1 domain